MLGKLLLGFPSDGAFVREEGAGLGGLSISVLPHPSQPRLIKETFAGPGALAGPGSGTGDVLLG